MSEVDRCNLTIYAFAHAFVLNCEQKSGELAAKIPQRRKKGRKCHVRTLSRETIVKLSVLCFSLPQFLFTGSTVRASALGTIN
jgi:hypothetical protein